MNLKFLHFSSTAACMALHLKKEMVPLVHAESVELLGMIRMVYSTFFQLGNLISMFPYLSPLDFSNSNVWNMEFDKLHIFLSLKYHVSKI